MWPTRTDAAAIGTVIESETRFYMDISANGRGKSVALALLASERPRNVGWKQAAGLLFGDWGTSRLYVLGLAFFYAQRSSLYLMMAMSGLILAVAWAYSNICRIYPDGGGVYTAAKYRSRNLAVVGALLLFADYTVTASLSVADAFRYFGLPETTHLLSIYSPGLWAILTIAVIGLFNFMGPKHTGAFALAAAVGMVVITLLVTFGSLPKVTWHELPRMVGRPHQSPGRFWLDFVNIVLALSGVEAIANLTGVMKRPITKTANKAIWTVAFEVAIFNILLALCMVAIHRPNAELASHRDDMMAYLSFYYVGAWAKLLVGALGGVLLISAGNTALTDMISIQYLMARDGELPGALQALNRFGVPWVPAVIAASVPCLVLLVEHDVEKLAALYAIGVVGAVAINVTLCAIHPRLRRLKRKLPMLALGVLLLVIWVTIAYVKRDALIFVAIVMSVGLGARALTKMVQARRGPRPSLLRQAIMEQLTPDVLAGPKIMLGTYGSHALANAALAEAKRSNHSLAVCFIRHVNLSYKYDGRQFTIDSDPVALRAFSRFLELGHKMGVPIVPIYDSGPDAAELLAENAAVWGCDKVVIGTSRRGALYHLIRGHFQQRLEALLPPEIPVEVVSPEEPPSGLSSEASKREEIGSQNV